MHRSASVRSLVSVFVFGFAVFARVPMSAAADDPAAATDSPPTNTDLAGITCSIGEERFLPADYYYCLASQSYGYQRYEKAQRYFKTSASWGSKPAEYILGVMALNGDQQPINRPLALAWFALAAERHRADFEKIYKELFASATPEELAASNAMLAELRLTYADDVAAVRAERRYRDSMLMLAHSGGFGVQCLSGARNRPGSNSDASGSNTSVACVQIQALTRTIDQTAEKVFDGWSGHVTVGQLQTVQPDAK